MLSPTHHLEPSARVRLGRFLRTVDVTSVVLATIFAGFVVIGASFAATDSTQWFASSPGAAVGSAFAIVVTGAVIYLPVRISYAWLDRRWARSRAGDPGVIPMRRAVRKWLLPSFGLLLAGWIPWLILHYPGGVDGDTITQLMEWRGLAPKNDHHPWFDTVVFGWFWELGHAVGDYNLGLFIYLIVQVTAMALGMAFVLTYLGRLGLGDWSRRILTIFAALFPVFAISGSVMSKDNLAGVFWLPLLILFVEVVRTRGRVLCRRWVGPVAIALAIPLVLARRPNVYVFILCIVLLVIVSVWPARRRLLIGAALVLLVSNVIWPRLVLPAAGVEPGTINDMLSIPLQQTARTVAHYGDRLPASERHAIDVVLRYKTLGRVYMPRRSDAVKARWNNGATTQQKLAYVRVWFVQFLRYPGTYLAATANNTYQYFAPTEPVNKPGELANVKRYIDSLVTKRVPGADPQEISDIISGLRQPAALTPARHAIDRATMASISGNLFASMAFFCSWLPLLALGLAIRRRNWLLALATVPLFINLLVLVAGPVAFGRYMVPMVLGSVLIAGLMMVPVYWQSSTIRPPRSDPPTNIGGSRRTAAM